MFIKILKYNTYNFLTNINKFLLQFGCILNSPHLCSLSWRISLFLLNFKQKNNVDKKILVLYKSFGSDDIDCVKKNKKNDFNFFYFPRNNFKIIFNYFFKRVENNLNDDKYFSSDETVEKAKKNYRNFLVKTLEIFNKKHNFKGILSFNFRYKAEKELHLACKILKIKFIVCQKESLHIGDNSPLTELYIKTNSLNGEFKGDYMTVYTKKFKEVLINASIISSKKIFVVGMPRADYYYENIIPKKKHVLLLMPFWMPPKNLEQKLPFDLKKYSQNITNVMLDFALKNPNENVVIKMKMFDKFDKHLESIIKKKNIKNILIKRGGVAKNLIRDAKVVVGFQTTGLLEALILRKPIIIPYTGIELSEMFEKCTLNLNEVSYYVKDNNSMIRHLEDICKNKIHFPIKDKSKVDSIIDHYIGNYDGKSSDRLLSILNKTLN